MPLYVNFTNRICTVFVCILYVFSIFSTLVIRIEIFKGIVAPHSQRLLLYIVLRDVEGTYIQSGTKFKDTYCQWYKFKGQGPKIVA